MPDDDGFVYTTEPVTGFQFIGAITDEMVESVMNDLLAGQVAIVKSLKADTQDGYMLALRNMTRSALTRALQPRRSFRETNAPKET